MVVVDSDSLSARRFTEGVVKRMKVRGCDIWLMTWIEDADDLFDAFNTNADMVLGPYHATGSDEDLSDILSVSDSLGAGCPVPPRGPRVLPHLRRGHGRLTGWLLGDAQGRLPLGDPVHSLP